MRWPRRFLEIYCTLFLPLKKASHQDWLTPPLPTLPSQARDRECLLGHVTIPPRLGHTTTSAQFVNDNTIKLFYKFSPREIRKMLPDSWSPERTPAHNKNKTKEQTNKQTNEQTNTAQSGTGSPSSTFVLWNMTPEGWFISVQNISSNWNCSTKQLCWNLSA